MSTDNRESLVHVFIAEAAEGLAKVWAALHPPDGSIPTPQIIKPQYIVGHSLRGAASLYGFSGIAGLSEILETTLEGVSAVPSKEWPGVLAMLRDLVDTLRAQVSLIAQRGTEDPACLKSWKTRRPDAGEASAATGSATVPEGTLAAGYLIPELDPEVCSYFAPEAQEYLDTIEASLLRLDKQPDDSEAIQLLYRTTHTLKGSAYTVGFTAIGDLIHHVEDYVGAIREGRLQFTPPLADLIFRAVDVVRLLMRRDPRNLEQMREEFAGVLKRLKEADRVAAMAIASVEEPVAVGVGAQTEVPAEAAEPLQPVEKSERVESERSQRSAVKEGDEGAVIRVSRERLERLLNLVGELVIGRGRLEQRLLTLEQLSNQVLMYKNRMMESVRTFEDKHAFTLPTPSPGTGGPIGPGHPQGDFSGLEFDRYDDFNILARRIAEVSADVSESMSQLTRSIRKSREDMSLLQRLTLGMREEIARARMVPIGTPFTRFRRAVREMARTTSKDVTLITSGEQTEVDTGVVERLVDPLVHLVRNAVYHGIETTAVRVAAGKPASGTIYLNAAHRGNAVVIEVEDDGGGIDVDKIKAKAVSLGLLRPEVASTLAEADAIKLIFLPGFTTATEVGNQAGRGVGLDVVKRVIEAMNGHIEIETQRGAGTKFTLNLPLTLLISMALVVKAGSERYALPLPSIREVFMPSPGAVQEIGGRSVLQVGDEAIEVHALAQLLGAEGAVPLGQGPVVIVRTLTGALGLGVDELLGRQEMVIKSLGSLKLFRESCFGGATIDPEGNVVLVIDVSRLLGGRTAEPLALAGEAPAVQLEGPEGGAPEFETGGSRILLIDDSLSVRKFVGRMLEGAGYQVETAVDGEEGLRKASSTAYRLIITDLEMPKLNGYEVIQALRVRPQTKSTPILVMTTRAGDKHRQMALSMGATGYVTKPVEERALIHEIETHTGGAGARV
jgi:chemosensory pili system protein ChpA (sensor histidine kinase/response regulator)